VKALDSVVKNYRKRIESYVTGTSSPGISYDDKGNKYWRGKKLVDISEWCIVRSSLKWNHILQLMPKKFEYGPLGVRMNLTYHPELIESFQEWLDDYYDYLMFIGDTTEVGEEMWNQISK